MEVLTCCYCNGLFDHKLPDICSQVSWWGVLPEHVERWNAKLSPSKAGSTRRNQGELKARKHVTFWLLLTKLQDTTGDGQHVITQLPHELKLRTRLPTVGCEGHAESAYDEHAKADKIQKHS